MLTQKELKKLLVYNPETGVVTHGRQQVGVVDSHGYVQIMVNGEHYLAHRLAWLYVHGYAAENSIEHINGIKTDNRIKNLRESNQEENKNV